MSNMSHVQICSFDTCAIEDSNFNYRPSVPLNSVMLALFALSLISNLIQGLSYKTWGFMIAMCLGNVSEVIGYGGRIWAYSDPWSQNPFLIQICCLTFAPAFFAAGIYLCLSRIVIIFGEDISRIPPKGYTYIFVACDFISLLLQAAGGGIASVKSQNHEDPSTGTNIMLAGLSFQVFTLSLFMALCAEYAFRVLKSKNELNETHAKLRASKKFRAFLCALTLSTICILIRSVYRVIEMAQGFEGSLIKDETLFFILEGVMVTLAVLIFNLLHPGWCFRESYINTKDSESSTELGAL